MRKHLKTAVKVIIVFGLLYFLGQKGFISVEATGRAFQRWDLLLPAFLMMSASTILGILRWRVLLAAQDIHLPFLRVAELGLVGNFFNIALPGAVSGDLVKAFYVAKEVDGARAKGFGSILFDRVAGVSALVLVSATSLLASFDRFQGTALLTGIQVFVGTAAAGVVAFYGYLFTFKDRHDPMMRLFEWLSKRVSAFGSILRIYQGIKTYRSRAGAVGVALLLSMAIHLIVCACAVLYLKALGVEGMSRTAVFVVVPLGLLVTAIPLMPAGVGTGHAAFLWLFTFLGTDRGADVFSLVAFYNILFGMIGGLVYLRFRAKDPSIDLIAAPKGT